MPICVSCTHPTQYLYTTYGTEDNIRLEQCSACHAFADPYVEQDTLNLWIDLVLLKRDVYRHLLYNRGTGVRKLDASIGTLKKDIKDTIDENATSDGKAASRRREKERWTHILKLAFVLVAIDAFIRWTHISSNSSFDPTVDIANWNQEKLSAYLRILAGCIIETIAFHSGVTFASYVVLNLLTTVQSWRGIPSIPGPGIQHEFRYSHVPLTLLYSSMNKLFLLFLLTIWKPASASASASRPLLQQYNTSHIFTNPYLVRALESLDDDKLDREWVVRNVLGGMAAGFGLRVVLDCHPVFTTIVILLGWVAKTLVANLVSDWVSAGIGGDDRTAGEMWLAYSIP